MKRQQGSSLIEVLVTIVIISVGLLGMANVQLAAMALNQNAYQRLQAVNLAHEIADSLFVNSTQAVAGDYTLLLNGNGNAPAGSVAAEDITHWIAQASRKLPSGRVVISSPQVMGIAANVKVYTITICWLEKNADIATPNTCGANNRAMFSFSASSRI